MSKNQRLNATITIGSVLEGSVKRNVGFLKSGLGQIGSAIKDVERRQKELDRQRNVLRRQGKSVDHLDREYDKLGRTLDDLRRKQERWNRAAAASRRVGTTFSAMSADIGRNVRRLAIGAGVAGGAIFGLASSTAKLGDDAAKTADKLGIGIAELQELRYAAERSGVSTGAFDIALEKMTKNIGLAMEGTGAQKDALDALGLSAADLATMLPEEALGLIADRMNDVGTQAEKAAIANDLFGRSGVGMINMLRGGSRGLQQLRDDARRTGYVLSEKAARDAEVFQDTLLDTQLVMKGLKNTVGAELMPVVTGVMKQIGDALVGNRKQVREWSEAFARNVEAAIPVIGQIATGIGDVIKVSSKMVSATADMVGGWENIGVIVGGILAGKTLLKIGKFATAVFSLGRGMLLLTPILPLIATGFRAIGTALIANPIGALITAIALGAVAIIENWDKIRPMLQPVFDWMESAITWLWKNVWSPIIDGITAGAGHIVNGWNILKSSLGAILDWIGEKFTWLMEKIQPVIDGMKWVAGNKSSVFDGMSDAQINAAGGRPTVKQTLGVGGLPASGSSTDLISLATPKALGGAYTPGWLLTGEAGPELKFENRSGYIANNRALRQMAGYASRIGSVMSSGTSGRGGSRVNALLSGGAGGAARPSAGGSIARQVTQNITYTINAAGASAEEVIRIIERKSRAAAGNGLFDRVPSTGLYGR